MWTGTRICKVGVITYSLQMSFHVLSDLLIWVYNDLNDSAVYWTIKHHK